MGGNLPSRVGPPQDTLTEAARRFVELGLITRSSHLYSTEPVGFADQPRFINAVIELITDLDPQQLLSALLAIEYEFGRERSAGMRNGPRTLDLDILLYGDAIIREPGLEIPHPRLTQRTFALVPLCEIAPSLIHPMLGKTMKELLGSLAPDAEKRNDEPTSFSWSDWPACVCPDGDSVPQVPDQPVPCEPEPYGR